MRVVQLAVLSSANEYRAIAEGNGVAMVSERAQNVNWGP